MGLMDKMCRCPQMYRKSKLQSRRITTCKETFQGLFITRSTQIVHEPIIFDQRYWGKKRVSCGYQHTIPIKFKRNTLHRPKARGKITIKQPHTSLLSSFSQQNDYLLLFVRALCQEFSHSGVVLGNLLPITICSKKQIVNTGIQCSRHKHQICQTDKVFHQGRESPIVSWDTRAANLVTHHIF